LQNKPRVLIDDDDDIEDADEDDKIKIKPLKKKPDDTTLYEDNELVKPTKTKSRVLIEDDDDESDNIIEEIKYIGKPHNKTKRARCPKGTYKNHKTGNCEEKKT
jgi:hypothetical protein